MAAGQAAKLALAASGDGSGGDGNGGACGGVAQAMPQALEWGQGKQFGGGWEGEKQWQRESSKVGSGSKRR